jgi:nucleoside-diphosphate-sugar epimerase
VGVSVAELIQVVVACAGREIPVVAAPSADRPVSATVASLIADPERAAAELGWRTRTSLKTGVARTVASTQEREAAGA